MKDYAEVGRAEEKMRSVIVVRVTLDSSQGETCLVISGSFELASPHSAISYNNRDLTV